MERSWLHIILFASSEQTATSRHMYAPNAETIGPKYGLSSNRINSELDFFEWSPIGNEIFMITDNMPTDTLISTLTQYPFPDSREIARGAGRADFIQPSLGPLQPNLDDLMDLDLDFLNFSRLAPVPEEASDDLLKAIEYNYSLGKLKLVSATFSTILICFLCLLRCPGSNQLTGPGGSIQETPGSLATGSSQQTNQVHQPTSGCIPQSQPPAIQYSAKIFTQTLQPSAGSSSPATAVQSSIAQQLSNAFDSYISDQLIAGGGSGVVVNNTQLGLPATQQQSIARTNSSEELARSAKSKFTRSYAKHNYDPKYPPTPHQTMAYNMVSQPHLGQTATGNAALAAYGTNAGGFPSVVSSTPASSATSSSTGGMLQMGGPVIPSGLTPGSMQLHYNHSAMQNTTTNPVNLSNSSGDGGGGNGNALRTQMGTANANAMLMQANNIGSKLLTHSQSLPVPALPQTKQVPTQPRSTSMPTGPNYSQMLAAQHSPPGSLHASQSGSSYKSYHGHQPQPYKIPSQTVGAGGSYASGEVENFAMPRYHQSSQKANAKLRTRSNSMIMKQQTGGGGISNAATMGMVGCGSGGGGSSGVATITGHQQHMTPTLHATTSEPMLNVTNSALLAQLLTTNSNNMSLSQQSLSPESAHDTDGPLSPTGLGGGSGGSGSGMGGVGSKFPRSDSQRRTGHIHAEQKRRYNIKNGFDTLHSLIPQLQQNPNAKLSKAAMLQKGADYIKQLRTERTSANDQMDALRREIDQLNNSLNNLHTALPASGAPVSRQRTGRVKELYQHYVRQRTLDNWKFWIFGLIFEPLLNSYNQTVSVANMDEMYRTSQLWVDQHCSLVELRPAVSNQLRQLSTTTDVLSDPPSSLQEEVLKAISSSSSSNCLVPRGSSSKGGDSSRGGSSTETSPHRS
uniref:BHLH domain-containing protein n=1 Tax=Anopheles farauti TaxID=69004 RepID=A0A182PZP1_9DIPT